MSSVRPRCLGWLMRANMMPRMTASRSVDNAEWNAMAHAGAQQLDAGARTPYPIVFWVSMENKKALPNELKPRKHWGASLHVCVCCREEGLQGGRPACAKARSPVLLQGQHPTLLRRVAAGRPACGCAAGPTVRLRMRSAVTHASMHQCDCADVLHQAAHRHVP